MENHVMVKKKPATEQDVHARFLALPGDEQRRFLQRLCREDEEILSRAGWAVVPSQWVREFQGNFNRVQEEQWSAINKSMDDKIAAQRNCERAKRVKKHNLIAFVTEQRAQGRSDREIDALLSNERSDLAPARKNGKKYNWKRAVSRKR
jgi:hypothetical protein